MNFYEFNDPYFAIIKARSMVEAVETYIKNVAGTGDDFDDLFEEIEPVNAPYASAKFARSIGEDGKMQDMEEVLKTLHSDQPEVLLIDGDLL